MKTRKKRILVVDDETGVTLLLRLILERRDYQVKVENDPCHAVQTAEVFKPDIILLDVDMPELNGGELASQLHDHHVLRSVPVVFLTGSVTKEEALKNKSVIGGSHFLAKPVDRGDLLVCLRRRLDEVSTERRSMAGLVLACSSTG